MNVFLVEENILDNLTLAHIRDELKEAIEEEITKSSLDSEARNYISVNTENELSDVYAASACCQKI